MTFHVGLARKNEDFQRFGFRVGDGDADRKKTCDECGKYSSSHYTSPLIIGSCAEFVGKRSSPGFIRELEILSIMHGTRNDPVSRWAQAQYRQIDIRIMLGKIGFEWFSAHAEGFLKAVGRKPSGVGSSVVFHARTLRKLLDILTHRAACAAPLSFAD
jgi:hypothetical protein